MVNREEVFIYFVRPNWGSDFVDNSKVVEVACSGVSISYNASYAPVSYFGNSRIEVKKSKPNSGSITLQVPLTAENFDFLIDSQNQSSDFSSVIPRIYQAGMLYSYIEFKSLSLSIDEDSGVVMEISFDFYDLSHCIFCVEVEDHAILIESVPDPSYDLTNTLNILLVNSNGDILESGENRHFTDSILVDEGVDHILLDDNSELSVYKLFAKDRFVLNEDLIKINSTGVPSLDKYGNFIVDIDHPFFDTAERDSQNVQIAQRIQLTNHDRMLHASSSTFTLQETGSDVDIRDTNILSLSYAVSRRNRVIKSIGKKYPRKVVKEVHETSTSLAFSLMEEQTQSLLIGDQKYESGVSAPPKFKLTIDFKDVENSSPISNIYIDGFFSSMQSNMNSLGVPQGSLTIIEKIT